MDFGSKSKDTPAFDDTVELHGVKEFYSQTYI